MLQSWTNEPTWYVLPFSVSVIWKLQRHTLNRDKQLGRNCLVKINKFLTKLEVKKGWLHECKLFKQWLSLEKPNSTKLNWNVWFIDKGTSQTFHIILWNNRSCESDGTYLIKCCTCSVQPTINILNKKNDAEFKAKKKLQKQHRYMEEIKDTTHFPG